MVNARRLSPEHACKISRPCGNRGLASLQESFRGLLKILLASLISLVELYLTSPFIVRRIDRTFVSSGNKIRIHQYIVIQGPSSVTYETATEDMNIF